MMVMTMMTVKNTVKNALLDKQLIVPGTEEDLFQKKINTQINTINNIFIRSNIEVHNNSVTNYCINASRL
jgi:hypothetical protein